MDATATPLAALFDRAETTGRRRRIRRPSPLKAAVRAGLQQRGLDLLAPDTLGDTLRYVGYYSLTCLACGYGAGPYVWQPQLRNVYGPKQQGCSVCTGNRKLAHLVQAKLRELGLDFYAMPNPLDPVKSCLYYPIVCQRCGCGKDGKWRLRLDQALGQKHRQCPHGRGATLA